MLIKVNTLKNCEINIKRGLFADKSLPQGFVITDANISKLYGNLIKGKSFLIQAGEESKTLETYKQIIDKLSETDESIIISFGGGVVGDLAGFVASTYKRGIQLIQIPTSLVAMVDSSIGGKNGVNLRDKKNYLGTIYQPSQILIDTSFIDTLPLSELKNGLAEIIKYHAIFSKPSPEKIKEGIFNKNFLELIYECCKIKAEVVEKDENDSGYRYVLNFGHTIGHAIELLSGLSHGESIAIGMAKEAEISEKLGYISKEKYENIISLLKEAGLPILIPQNIDVNKAIELMKKDKKGSLVFAFSEKDYNICVDENKLKQFLA